MIGWVFDQNGKLLNRELNQRVASAKLSVSDNKLIYGIASGKEKVPAIHGALQSSLLNCLITNEYTAEALLHLY